MAERLAVFLAGVLLVSNPGVAGPCDRWDLIAETAQGRIYHRCVPGSTVPEAMIETQFAAAPSQLRKLVTDYEHFEEFIPNVVESRVLKVSDGYQWVFHRLHFPGPVADRVYVLRSGETRVRNRDNHYRVSWQLVDGQLAAEDVASARVPDALSGFWEIRPAHDSATTAAQYAVHSDPGGFIPGWLVAKMTDRYLQRVIAAIRERLSQAGRK